MQVVSPPAEICTSTLLEAIDYVSRASREGQAKEQILTSVFLMLDREFEQSIAIRMEDIKKGRYGRVPSREDQIMLFRKLADKARWLRWQVRYTDEFVESPQQLTYGQQRLKINQSLHIILSDGHILATGTTG